MAVPTSVAYAALTISDRGVYVVGHVRQIVRGSQHVLHSSLVRVSCHRWSICQIQNSRSIRGRCSNLNGIVDYKFSKKKSSPVDVELKSGVADIEGVYLTVFVEACLVIGFSSDFGVSIDFFSCAFSGMM